MISPPALPRIPESRIQLPRRAWCIPGCKQKLQVESCGRLHACSCTGTCVHSCTVVSEKRALLYEKEDAPAVESAFVFTASDGRRRAAPRSLGNQRETVRPTPALAGPLVRNLLGRGRGGWEGMWGGVGLAEVCACGCVVMRSPWRSLLFFPRSGPRTR